MFGRFHGNNFEKAENDFVFSNLVKCLRSSESVGADRQIEQGQEQNYNYCNNSDQICEAVSDWFSSEVITKVISKNHPHLTTEQWRNGFANTFKAKCDQPALNGEFDPHPHVKQRFNGMMLSNESVREKMGCGKIKAPKKQCSNDPDFLTTNPTNTQSSRGER